MDRDKIEKNVYEAELSTKSPYAALNGHFVLSLGRKQLYEIHPFALWELKKYKKEKEMKLKLYFKL